MLRRSRWANLTGGRRRFLDFCAPRNGSSVRELQITDIDNNVSEYFDGLFYQGWENPHASGCSRFYIASILDARASGAGAHPDVA
jgi:hypothetical protein